VYEKNNSNKRSIPRRRHCEEIAVFQFFILEVYNNCIAPNIRGWSLKRLLTLKVVFKGGIFTVLTFWLTENSMIFFANPT